MKEDNEELLEESEYSRKSEFSKATLVQEQVQRCLILRSKDMRPGYTTFKIDKYGEAHPQIIPDSRKEFVSAVEALKNLMSPEIKTKKLKLNEQYETLRKELFEKYAYKERLGKGFNKEGKAVWVYSGRVYLPHEGHIVKVDDPKFPNSCKTISVKDGWKDLIDAYWDELVNVADNLFQELNDLIHKLDYFKGGFSF